MEENIGTLITEIVLDGKKFTGQLQAIGKEGEIAGKAIGDNISKGAQKATSSLDQMKAAATSLMYKLAALYSIHQMTSFVKETALLAARFETLGVVMTQVAKISGLNTAEVVKQEMALRKQGISMVEARSNLTSMMQAQIDVTKATKLARIAQDAAVIGDINSSEAFARMIHGIKSGQTEILRNIGLQVSNEAAYKKLADTLKIKTSALTENQKMQARVNAVMEEGAKIVGVYEAAMETAGKKLNSFKRYIDDFKVKMGEAFGPAMVILIDAATESMKKMQVEISSPAAQESLKNIALDLSKIVKILIEEAPAALKKVTEALKTFFDVYNAIGGETVVAFGLGLIVWKLFGSFQAGAIVTSIILINAALRDLKDTIDEILNLGGVEAVLGLKGGKQPIGTQGSKGMMDVFSGKRHWNTGEYSSTLDDPKWDQLRKSSEALDLANEAIRSRKTQIIKSAGELTTLAYSYEQELMKHGSESKWSTGMWKEGERKLPEADKNAAKAAEARLKAIQAIEAQYYNQAKFQDTNYYKWQMDLYDKEKKEHLEKGVSKLIADKMYYANVRKLELELWAWRQSRDPVAFQLATDDIEKAKQNVEDVIANKEREVNRLQELMAFQEKSEKEISEAVLSERRKFVDESNTLWNDFFKKRYDYQKKYRPDIDADKEYSNSLNELAKNNMLQMVGFSDQEYSAKAKNYQKEKALHADKINLYKKLYDNLDIFSEDSVKNSIALLELQNKELLKLVKTMGLSTAEANKLNSLIKASFEKDVSEAKINNLKKELEFYEKISGYEKKSFQLKKQIIIEERDARLAALKASKDLNESDKSTLSVAEQKTQKVLDLLEKIDSKGKGMNDLAEKASLPILDEKIATLLELIKKFQKILDEIKNTPVGGGKPTTPAASSGEPGGVNTWPTVGVDTSYKTHFDTIQSDWASMNEEMTNATEEAGKAYQEALKQREKDTKDYAEKEKAIKRKAIADMIALYAEETNRKIDDVQSVMGATSSALEQISQLYTEGSKEREKYHKMAMAFETAERVAILAKAVVTAVAAVAAAAANSKSWVEALVAIAAVGGALAGVFASAGVSFGGRGGSKAPSKPASTVLGAEDGTGSESLSKSYKLMEETYSMEYEKLTDIFLELKKLNSNITGLVNSIVRTQSGLNGNFVGNYDYQAFATKLSKEQSKYLGGLVAGHVVGQVIGEPTTITIAALMGQNKGITKVLNDILGGSKKAKVTGTGISLDSTTIAKLTAGDNIVARAYADITQKTEGGWFKSDKTKRWREFEELEDETIKLFTDVYSSLSKTLILLAEKFGTDVQAAMSYIFPAINIDFTGMNSEQINKALTDYFSKIGDDAAKALFGDIIKQYQKVGEGMLETAVRLVQDMEVVQEILEKTNQGIGTVDIKQLIAFSEALIEVVGSLEGLIEAFSNYYDKFFSKAQKQADLHKDLTEMFTGFGMALPTSAVEYRRTLESLNLNSEDGMKAYGKMLAMAEAADKYYAYLEDQLVESKQKEINIQEDMVNEQGELVNKLQGYLDKLKAARESMQMEGLEYRIQQVSQAQLDFAKIAAEVKAGNFDVLEDIDKAMSILTSNANSTDTFATLIDYQRNFYKTSNAIAELEGYVQDELTVEEKTLATLEDILAVLVKQLEEMQGSRDAALDAAFGSTSGYTAPYAGTTNVVKPAGGAAGGGASSVSPEQDYLNRYPDVAASSQWGNLQFAFGHFLKYGYAEGRTWSGPITPTDVHSPYNYGNYNFPTGTIPTSPDAQAQSIMDTTLSNIFNDGHAQGGYHEGGYRIVGEQGPEVEWTGASRIYSNPDSKKLMDNSEIVSELKKLREDFNTINYQIAKNTQKSTKVFERWDVDGIPEERVLA